MREGKRRGEEMALEDPLLTVAATLLLPPEAYWGGGGEMEQAGKQPLAFRRGRSLSRESYGERGGKKGKFNFLLPGWKGSKKRGKATHKESLSLSLSHHEAGGEVKRANRRQRREKKKGCFCCQISADDGE